jgi:hypothetical protein
MAFRSVHIMLSAVCWAVGGLPHEFATSVSAQVAAPVVVAAVEVGKQKAGQYGSTGACRPPPG